MLRKPIVTVVGHVDHGKTSLLDKIRQTAVNEREAGKITQAIGASIIPTETLQRVCGKLLEKMSLNIPGLLFIDTPGHAAFSTLRKRGGSLADIAILVVDINEGFMPQTEEAIEILKAAKTPFVIAATKVDLLPGWKPQEGFFLPGLEKQSDQVKRLLDEKVYGLAGMFYEHFQFNVDRFDRVNDYTKQMALVPISSVTGEGLPELLMVLVGLVQKYLEQGLVIDDQADAKGTILEVKEQQGLGKVLDVIVYDGKLNSGDDVVIGGLDKPVLTKIRGLFEPAEHSDMREQKANYVTVKEAVAATGVRVYAPDVEDVLAGMPLLSTRSISQEEAIAEVQGQVSEVVLETDKEGVIVKADTLGSLEALLTLLKERHVPIRKASIGAVTKKDIADAQSNYEKNPLHAVILAFNVSGETKGEQVNVIASNIIYKVIESYELWVEQQRKGEEAEKLEGLVRPCLIEFLKGYVFRQSNPAVIGVSVEQGTLKTGMPLMNKEGVALGTVKGLQEDKENVSEAIKGKQVACSINGVTVGRQIHEGDTFFSDIPEQDFITLKELKHLLSKEDIEILKTIAEIKRKNNPVWGI